MSSVVRSASTVAQVVVDRLLGAGVDGAGRVVEHQYRGIGEDRAGERDALPLAAGQRQAALADDGVVALRAVAVTNSCACAARAAASTSASVASGRP